MEIDPLVEELRRDNTSRSGALVEQGARALVAFAGGFLADTPEEFQRGLVSVGRKLFGARPSLAPLFHLVTELYALAGEPAGLVMIRRSIRSAAVDFTQTSRDRDQKVARQGAALLGGAGRVLCLGGHEAVERALLVAVDEGSLASICIGEGRPRCLGRRLATKLAAAGALNVRVVTDSALPSQLPDTDLVLVGADAVRADGAVVHYGHRALAEAARAAGKPTYALAGVFKFLPLTDALPDPCSPGDPREVWDAPPEGVTVENHLREILPLTHLKGIVTEAGSFSPHEAETRIRALPVPPWLTD